jgi:hypothetical protein
LRHYSIENMSVGEGGRREGGRREGGRREGGNYSTLPYNNILKSTWTR